MPTHSRPNYDKASVLQKPLSSKKPFIDEDGLQLEIVGWHKFRKRTRYLVKYTAPEVKDRATHALIDRSWVPPDLLDSFEASEETNLEFPKNQGGHRIRLNTVIRVLDMAWCSGLEPDCTSDCLTTSLNASYYKMIQERDEFYDFFLLLEWRDELGSLRRTWEYAETLMKLMDPGHCMSLLSRWASEIDRRQEQLLSKVAPEQIPKVLGQPGWQYI
ncbi:hypothetical protein CC78DRAFT_585733 [Lojkania enalia]|uniref:Uncharacterized protein n=1 Tax=Lojkania enalia TaxID=147567 RepID=A0A9P4N5N0_9PLEO|nr:hypothetical protein CC78DRAFT_585733 [Didymosphaeria enalia]